MIPKGAFDDLEHERKQLTTRDTRTHMHVTAAEFRQHLRQVSLVVTVFCHVVIAYVAIMIAFDIHAIRTGHRDELVELIEFRKGFFARFDSMLWKMDTQAQETGQMAGTLADALVKMRAQVKESTDTGAKTATATNTIAREAVKQAAATTQLVQQVAAQPEPVVNVEVPKGTPSPVVVQTAPAPAAHPAPAPLAHYPVEHHTRSRWHWLRLLWPLGKDAERAQQ